MMIRTKQNSFKINSKLNERKIKVSKSCKNSKYLESTSKYFDVVGLIYPNEWRSNTAELYSDSKKLEPFNWFICSYRMYDYDTKMYYSSISPDVHFYSNDTGKTMTAKGLSKNNRNDRSSSKIPRTKLLILSDPHNKKMLCKQFGYMCGCNSSRDVLSKECHLTINSGDVLTNGAKYAIKLGYDGVVIQHDCIESKLDTSDAIICQNATFVFKKSILEPVDDSHPNRCGIVRYSKKHNSCIRKTIPNFPTSKEIDDLLEDNNCSVINIIIYDIVKMYMKKRNNVIRKLSFET